MDVANKNIYYNSIYKAVVVNVDETTKNVQIFIPATMGQYTKYVQSYMNDSNKSSNKYKDYFPWAVSLIDDLEPNDIVYGGYIDNKISNMIIIGRVGNSSSYTSTFSGSVDTINGSGLVDLLMPIMVENEVGVNRKYWPDNIPNSFINWRGENQLTFGYFNPNDNNKGWSIGLIQWHNSRAFHILYEIAKVDSNWESRWPDKNLQIVSDLRNAIKNGSSSAYENKWCIAVYDSTIQTGTKNMLTSDIGKKTQIDAGTSDGLAYINTVKNVYKIDNPAAIIFIADIVNQYGSITLNEAALARTAMSGAGGDMMNQFEALVKWWNSYKNGAYQSRRNNTAQYIRELYKAGKLNTTDLTNMAGSADEGGKYLWPAPTCHSISCYYGQQKGYFHYGVDLVDGTKSSEGQPVIAVANGTVTHYQSGYVHSPGSEGMASYGNMIFVNFGDTCGAVYAHLSEILVKKGDTVQAGQVIGKIGNTGNSSGPHLHFEFRLNVQAGAGYSGTHVNPLPYIKKS